MPKVISDEAIVKATGQPLKHWFRYFDSIDGKKLSHKDIALKAHEAGIPHWWSQMVTVEYEKHIGRRKAGDSIEGFPISVSATLENSIDETLKKWQNLTQNKKEFNDIKVQGEFRISQTDKWRYWKADLEDGTKIAVNISDKPDSKSNLSLTHERIETKKKADEWKNYWKEYIQKL